MGFICAQKLINRNAQRAVLEKKAVKGNLLDGIQYWQLCKYRYRMALLGMYIPLDQIFKYIGYVITFLFIWYHNVKEDENLKMNKNFITTEAFRDCIISCINRVNLIRYARDLGSKCKRCYSPGTQDCELLFALIGGFTFNTGKREYTFTQALRACSNENTIRKYEVMNNNGGEI